MNAAFARRLHAHWQGRGWLPLLLSPLAALVWLAVKLKRWAFAAGLRRAYRAPVPVAVVGNIFVGGTGKTPVVIALVQALRERGWTPGVVSRGYGVAIGKHARVGQGQLAANHFGDEPCLIAAATGVPVAVHPRRALAAQALLRAHPDVDVIVADDGLQHLALARDVEIVVQDARGTGNGWVLPAGPLREPPARLQSVDVVIDNVPAPPPAPGMAQAPAARPRRVQMWMEPGQPWRVRDGERRPLWSLQAQHNSDGIAAAAGIGSPERFFSMLRGAGVNLVEALPLPDHYSYARSPFEQVKSQVILVTTKDAVKCSALGDHRVWAVPVTPHFSDAALFDWIAALLRRAEKLH